MIQIELNPNPEVKHFRYCMMTMQAKEWSKQTALAVFLKAESFLSWHILQKEQYQEYIRTFEAENHTFHANVERQLQRSIFNHTEMLSVDYCVWLADNLNIRSVKELSLFYQDVPEWSEFVETHNKQIVRTAKHDITSLHKLFRPSKGWIIFTLCLYILLVPHLILVDKFCNL